MTRPRIVLPGTTYLVTRRCSERRFFMTPDEKSNQILRFVLALAAERHGVDVHGFVFMANHVHLAITDVEAKLPRFMQDFASLSARALNVHLKRRESFWSPEGYNAVDLLDDDAVVRKTAYTIANPVAADLVRRHQQWPGAMSRLSDLGRTAYRVQRPKGFFREDGPVPAEATLRLTLPPGFRDRETFMSLVAAEVRRLEEAAEARRRSKNKEVLGLKKLARQDPLDRPRTFEPLRQMRPTVAGFPQNRARALRRQRAFLVAHEEARKALNQGRRDVVFPAGTWDMRVRFGVECAAPG